jgi:NADH-quinone oxidoreductase subunit F
MPRRRPPFPAVSGLWKKPTNINNVETYANVPQIILYGAGSYNKYGSEKSKGTKVFALTGKIKKGGLVEVPMGTSIHDIIFKLGGGIQDDKRFKAVQLGGPSGGCIPSHLSDTIVDYDSVNATGAIMGSGGMVVMDETTCMVDIARFFLDFTQKESCGKCTFCRIGTKRMLEILTRITEGEGREGDIEKLEELSYQIKDSSLCGLGQTAPNPVLTTIKYFRDEYEAHIKDKKCPAYGCKKLLTYTVIEDKCTGCVVCAKNCPVNCISGERKKVHFINQETCIKCGVCFTKCKFEAIRLS